MRTTRRDLIPFSFYDHTGMEKHLEKMAQKGWMLEELTNWGWKYRAIQPQKLHFSVSFDTRASDFEPEPTEEQMIFQEFCQRSGWKLAAAQRGEFLPTRGCHKLLCVVVAVVIVGLIYWLATERLPGMRFLMGGLLLAYVVVFLSVNGTKRTLKRRKASAGVNRAITLSLDVILSVILVGAVMFLLIRGLQSGAISVEQEISAPLSASDLTGVDEEKYLTTVSTDMSLFLDRQEVQCRTGFDREEELPGMDYTSVKLHVPFLYNACFRELCREKEERVATLVGGDIVRAQYMEVDPTPWGAEKAYQLNLAGKFRQEYILCWKNRIVQLGADWDLTAEQMALAGEKLANA